MSEHTLWHCTTCLTKTELVHGNLITMDPRGPFESLGPLTLGALSTCLPCLLDNPAPIAIPNTKQFSRTTDPTDCRPGRRTRSTIELSGCTAVSSLVLYYCNFIPQRSTSTSTCMCLQSGGTAVTEIWGDARLAASWWQMETHSSTSLRGVAPASSHSVYNWLQYLATWHREWRHNYAILNDHGTHTHTVYMFKQDEK